MKASELRIGNFVNLYGDECRIQTVGMWVHTDTTVDEAPIESVKPVPLTDEWLLKFGFEDDEPHYKLELFAHGEMTLCLVVSQFEKKIFFSPLFGRQSNTEPNRVIRKYGGRNYYGLLGSVINTHITNTPTTFYIKIL